MKTARLIITGKSNVSRYCIIYGKKIGDGYYIDNLPELKNFMWKMSQSLNRRLVKRALEEGI